MKKVISLRDMQKALKGAGYNILRYNGSHQIWSNGENTVSIPSVKLNPALAIRIVKELNLNI